MTDIETRRSPSGRSARTSFSIAYIFYRLYNLQPNEAGHIAKSSILPFRMSDADALRHLRTIAAEPARVRYAMHAKERMVERKVFPEHVVKCIQRGRVTESPTLDLHGNWQLRVEHYMAGQTLACAVAIDIRRPQAIVITTFWVS